MSRAGERRLRQAFTAANSNSGDHAWTYTDEPEPDEEASDEVVASDVGIAPHTDFEAFTLMHQDAPGLQLLRKKGPVSIEEFYVRRSRVGETECTRLEC